jgi:hypothetical protein
MKAYARLWDSVVGIATGYGLDGPETEFQLGLDFLHPSRPILGPTQRRIQWVPGFLRELSGRDVALIIQPI